MELFAEYSFWWVIPCLLLGLGLAYLLYRKDSRLIDLPTWLRGLLIALRTLVIAGIAFLLLGPFFKYIERQIQKPVILIAQDNSSSILLGPDSAFYAGDYLQQFSVLETALSEQFEVQPYSFDKDLSNTKVLDFTGKQSDIGKALKDMLERNINRNIGAVVLATDGIFNKGVSPANISAGAGVPFYTLALGDTTIKRDMLIENVAHNRLAYLGNDFPAEIQVRADRLKGKTSTVRIRKGGQELFSKSFEIDDDVFVLSVPALLNASQVGRMRYDVSVTAHDDELSEENNYRSFYIDVLDSRQKVLIVYSAPHPDLGAIRQSIESNENYEVELSKNGSFKDKLSDYDLLILHGLPRSKGIGEDLIRRAKNENVPTWIIGGIGTSWTSLQKHGYGVNVVQKKGTNTTDASPSHNRSFSLFTMSESLVNATANWAPLKTSFAEFSAEPSAQVLFDQRIGVVDTDQPLWVFNEIDGYKSSLTTGEGLWRWRIQNFVENNGHNQFDELISRTVQYLASKEDRRQFRVYNKDTFDEDQNVIIEAEFYNQSFEPINSSEVTVTLTDQDGNEFDFVFSRTQSAYYLDAGRLGPGEYSYEAMMSFEGKNYRSAGSLTVKAIQIEAVKTRADHQLLYRMAQGSGGQMFYPNQMTELAETLKSKEDIVPVIYSTEQMTDLIDSPWLLFLFIALLAIEWFVRKYKGAY